MEHLNKTLFLLKSRESYVVLFDGIKVTKPSFAVLVSGFLTSTTRFKSLIRISLCSKKDTSEFFDMEGMNETYSTTMMATRQKVRRRRIVSREGL